MPILYNCRHAGDEYKITKFDKDMNVESSYLCSLTECNCPAGVRPTCRHREMLPKFIQRDHVGDEWFYDHDRGGWVQMGSEWILPAPFTDKPMSEEELSLYQAPEPHSQEVKAEDFDSSIAGSTPAAASNDPDLPPEYAQEAIEAETQFQEMARAAKPKALYIRRRI